MQTVAVLGLQGCNNMKMFFCNGKKAVCNDNRDTACMDCEFLSGTGGYFIELGENPYWERICELANYQRSKGIGKYGKGLEDNPAAMIARITHLQEELIDGLMYCEWIKDKLMELEGEEHD